MQAKNFADIYEKKRHSNLIFVEEDKLIFCGPEIDDGCKIT